jgi:hypothetical protein
VAAKIKLKRSAPPWRLDDTKDFYTLLLYGTIDPQKFLPPKTAKEVDKAINLLYAFEVAMTKWSDENEKDI